MINKRGYFYILGSKRNGTTYIGVTSNLKQRVYQHKQKTQEGFSKEYNVLVLVYYEIHEDIRNALTREKQLKKWNREWKLNLIEKDNPQRKDLSEVL